jgi:hypothetical protein
VLEHLLTDHDVELAWLRGRRAQIERRVVELLKVLPASLGLTAPADLDRRKSGTIELANPTRNRVVEALPQPMLLG